MARRRPPVATWVATEPDIPDRLRNPVIEGWVTLAEVAVVRAELSDTNINGKPAADNVQEVSWRLRMRARLRARDARNRWAVDAGVDAHMLSSGKYGNAWPSDRDESIFLAEIRRAIRGRQ